MHEQYTDIAMDLPEIRMVDRNKKPSHPHDAKVKVGRFLKVRIPSSVFPLVHLNKAPAYHS